MILERRNGSGKVHYKPIQGGWNGSEDDKHKLLEELDRLRKDPSVLSHDAMLPELNNEFASVSLFEPPLFTDYIWAILHSLISAMKQLTHHNIPKSHFIYCTHSYNVNNVPLCDCRCF